MTSKKTILTTALTLSLLIGGWAFINEARADSSAAIQSLTPNSIADVAEKAAPAVVNIDISKPVVAPTSFMGRPIKEGQQVEINGKSVRLEDFLKRLQERYGNQEGSGTGFVIKKDGYIVTNNHVVTGANKIEVSFQNGKTYEASIVGTDSFSDLAVLKINANDLPTLSLGESKSVRPGEFVVAIGSPLGYKHTVTFGIISAVGRDVRDINGNINFLQTDAAINRGNSGGPLINMKGEVIGVNTAIITKGFAQNIGFAIPADIADGVIENLIKNKVVQRPWIGIAMAEVDEHVAETLNLPPNTKGVAVGEVFKNSPAIASGIMTKDVIQKMDGKSVQSPKEVRDYILAHKVDQSIKISLLRDGRPMEVSIKIGQYPEQPPVAGRGR